MIDDLLTFSLIVTATIGAFGRYFEIIRAVFPLSVGVIIALHLNLMPYEQQIGQLHL